MAVDVCGDIYLVAVVLITVVVGWCGGERERTQNSELYYSRIEILGICLFLQFVLANLHANTYTRTVRISTTIIQ